MKIFFQMKKRNDIKVESMKYKEICIIARSNEFGFDNEKIDLKN